MIKFDPIPEEPKPLITQQMVLSLTPPEIARCRELSFGKEGYMCEDLDDILQRERRYDYRCSQAILLGEPPAKPQMTQRPWPIYGWALLQPVYRRPKWSAQFFVDPLHRGKGYGRMLLERANRHSPHPMVYIDDDNEGFFNKYSYMVEEVKEMSA